MSTDIPTSGYVCFEAMEAYSDVLVCYRADVPEAATLRVRRYGTKASIATQINNLRKKVDLKSFVDGYYESMRVGTADNLTSKGDAMEEVIMSRKAGGDNQIEDGSASIKRIKGDSVVMNQWCVAKEDEENVNTTGTAWSQCFLRTKIPDAANGHYYVLTVLAKGAESGYYTLSLGNNGGIKVDLSPTYKFISVIIKRDNTNSSIALYDSKGSGEQSAIKRGQVFDLTQMFGSGNEPSTPDDFAKRLGYSSIDDVPYISYNEGEIVSSFAEGIKTSSRNLMKGLSEMEMFNSYFGFSLPTNSDYHLSLKKRNPLANTPKGSIGFIWDYDRQAKALWAVDDGVEKNLSFALRTSYYNNGKIIFGVYPQTLAQEFLATYEIQIEFGTEPTDYVQPQSWVRKWKNTIDKYFPDGLKSAGSVYDEITPTKAVKRIETIDLGELNWGYNNESSSKKAFFSIERFDSKTNGNFDYIVSSDSLFKKPFTPIFWDKSLIIETEVDYNSISELKKALSGVKLCFEYAPEEYTYDELNLTEQVAEG